MEIDTTPPSGTGAAPAPSLSYGDARREILDALAAAMATVHSAQRAPEKLVREQLERRLAKVLPPEPESATPETAQRPAEGDVAGLERTRAAELRKLLDSQGWRIEVGKVLVGFK